MHETRPEELLGRNKAPARDLHANMHVIDLKYSKLWYDTVSCLS